MVVIFGHFVFVVSYLEPDDPSFIGCWWLPFLIFGALVLLSAIPMLFCPKHLPHYYKMKIRLRKLKKLRKLQSVEDMKPRGFKQKTKGELKHTHYVTLILQDAVYFKMIFNGINRCIKVYSHQNLFPFIFAVAFESIKGIFTNVPYMTLVISTLCCYYILPSIYQQVPKYLNIQFHIDPSTASIYTGISLFTMLVKSIQK